MLKAVEKRGGEGGVATKKLQGRKIARGLKQLNTRNPSYRKMTSVARTEPSPAGKSRDWEGTSASAGKQPGAKCPGLPSNKKKTRLGGHP